MDTNTIWLETHKALNAFNKILTCKKCNEKISNPKQFLNCGHFFCANCVETETTCSYCKIPGEASDIYSDRTLKNLLFNLNIIADIVELPLEKKNQDSDLNLSISKEKQQNSQTNITNIEKPTVHKVHKKKSGDEFIGNSICESFISESNTSKSTLKKQKSIPKNINKKNMKGETALHLACRKNNVDRIKALLEAGADPNTKDNANWTPLQEAANYGYYEACELLLKAGALPNFNGYDNKTALHEAVINDDFDLVSLLLSHNANKDVFDNVGKKPKDYCTLNTISNLFTTSSQDATKICTGTPSERSTNISLDESSKETSCNTKILLYGSNLNKKNRKLLTELAVKKKLKFANNLSSLVSHVIVETNEFDNLKLSFDVLLAILYGKWILRSDCLAILIDGETITSNDLNLFEMNPPQLNNGPANARENEENQKPKLFNNCYFYFAIKSYTPIEYNGMHITKESLAKLVSAGDGIMLTREPRPEDIQGSLSPFHVAHVPKHSLHKCTHYIIYVTGDCDLNKTQSNSKRIMYKMPVLRSLPLMWFIESILRFKLIDPIELGLE